MSSIDWCYFTWPWVTLTTTNCPIFNTLYCISYLRSGRLPISVNWTFRVEFEASNLVGMLTLASASRRMANHAWKGVVMSCELFKFWWASRINHIYGTADRLRRWQLNSSAVSVTVVQWQDPVTLLGLVTIVSLFFFNSSKCLNEI